MDRLAFRQINQLPGLFEAHTSGSTGTAVTVQKYQAQLANLHRASEMMQRMHKIKPGTMLKLSPLYDTVTVRPDLVTAPHYIPGNYSCLMSFPSCFPDDMTQFDKVISYGEKWTGVGIDLYSSEEFGTIAIQCPFNSNVLHIMPNLHIDFTPEGMRITDIDHPYLKDYEIGDYAEPATCTCGTRLKAMTHVRGRIRNMMKMPDGMLRWPKFGLLTNRDVKRFQFVQTSLTDIDVHIDGVLSDDAQNVVKQSLGYPFNLNIIQGNFRPGKHEEFICMC